jgi:hypothetical protein
MPKNLNKYFWDGEENVSGTYRLKRILEYASFPDLIAYPFGELKKYLQNIPIDKLRTSQKRKDFIKLIMPFVSQAENWDDVFKKIINLKFEEI